MAHSNKLDVFRFKMNDTSKVPALDILNTLKVKGFKINVYSEAALTSVPRSTGHEKVNLNIYTSDKEMSYLKLNAESNYVQTTLDHLVAFATLNPEFIKTHPIGIKWVDAGGNFCYALFCLWGASLEFDISQDNSDEGENWLACDISKVSAKV